LNDRELPDGNLYKLEEEIQQDNQGADEPKGPRDFVSIRRGMTTRKSEAWWAENTDIQAYARYKGVAEVLAHYDQRDGRQGYYYRNPETEKWMLLPWDCDAMFSLTPKYYAWDRFRLGIEPRYPQNHLIGKNEQREVLDLLFNEKAVDTVLAELVDIVNPVGTPLTLADMDLFAWNYNPLTRGQYRGSYNVLTGTSEPANTPYTRTLISADHEGQMDFIQKFMQPGGHGYDNLVNEAADQDVPDTPVITYSGLTGYPSDGLAFTSSTFDDPNGSETFAAMEWRIAEISDENAPNYNPVVEQPYEVHAIWESGEMASFESEVQIPAGFLRSGSSYRARVRHQDESGRWSHWSAPHSFIAEQPDVAAYLAGLVFSEVMYHPQGDADLEFIELMNVGPVSLSLAPLRFIDGVLFDFSTSAIDLLAPGERVLVVKNLGVFEAEYGVGLNVAGEFASGALSNGGERVALAFGGDIVLQILEYSDGSSWPAKADGGGRSLVLINPEGGPSHVDPLNWRSSVADGGNPGASDAVPYSGQELLSYSIVEGPIFDAEMFTLSASLNAGADDALVLPEWSEDMETWHSGGFQVVGREPEVWRMTETKKKLFLRLKAASIESRTGFVSYRVYASRKSVLVVSS